MDNDRRKLIASMGAVGIASVLFPGAVYAGVSFDAVKVTSREQYAARINEWFYLHSADDTHQGNLQLVEVRDVGSNKRVQQFAAIFCSYEQAVPMPSGYYSVAAERFNLFVKRTHELNGRHYYRAEFALLQ